MDEPLRQLILRVIHVCDRTCDLAASELRGPFALEPLRDAIDALLRSVDGVEQSDSSGPGFPVDELRAAAARLGGRRRTD
jgi:hypothetical protein